MHAFWVASQVAFSPVMVLHHVLLHIHDTTVYSQKSPDHPVSCQLSPMWLDLQPVDIKSRWRHNWKSGQAVNSHLVCDPTIRQPGFDLSRQQWSLLNRFRTAQGHCGACRRKWRLTDTDLCPCGETQTMSHIVESCPLTKLNGDLSRLHSADEDAVSWLTSYGSWHAYEKKKKKPNVKKTTWSNDNSNHHFTALSSGTSSVIQYQKHFDNSRSFNGPWLVAWTLPLSPLTVWPFAALQQPHRWEQYHQRSHPKSLHQTPFLPQPRNLPGIWPQITICWTAHSAALL